MKRRVAMLSCAALLGACAVVLGPDRSATRLALFDEFWSQLDRHYSFFELKRIDWQAVREVYRPQAEAAMSDGELAQLLGRMIDTLDDVHVVLNTPLLRYQSGDSALAVQTNYSELTVRVGYVAPVSTPSGRIMYGMLLGQNASGAPPVVGYMRIPSFSGKGWGGETDIVLRKLGPMRGLIIDVRNNGGGNDSNARDIAARFTNARRPFSYVQFRNGPRHTDFTPMRLNELEPAGVPFTSLPVVVLTNRQEFSATEDFALMMRAIPTVALLGDTTGGGSGNPLQRELSNGWRYQFSESITYTLDKRSFEEVGIAPDVVVKQTAAAARQGIDLQIDAAIQLINSRPAPVVARSSVEARSTAHIRH